MYIKTSSTILGPPGAMIHASARLWLAIFQRPRLLEGIRRSSAAATIRRPVTANSREMMIRAAHALISPSSISATSAALTSNLSARLSRNDPNTVTCPSARAIRPSTQSVSTAPTNTPNATQRPPGMSLGSTSSSVISAGMAMMRVQVTASGAFNSGDDTDQ